MGLMRCFLSLLLMSRLVVEAARELSSAGTHALPDSFSLEDPVTKATMRSQAGQDKLLWEKIFKDTPHYKQVRRCRDRPTL